MDSNASTIISNVIWKFAERMLAQIVSLVVSIVLARLLLPEHFGAISMVMVFITIADVFVTSGIPSALIQKKDADQLDYCSVFYFNILVSLVLYLLIFVSSGSIATFYNTSILKPVLRVLGLRLIIAAVNSVQHAYVSRHMMFRKYFWSTLFGTVLSGVVGILMAYKGCGVWALVAQYMINTLVDTVVLFITVDWKPEWQFSLFRVKKLFSFGWKILFEGVANAFDGQIRNLVIGKVYTADDLAFYTRGPQFPAVIVNNITTSIGSVLFPAMANVQGKPEKVLLMLRRSIQVSSYVIYPMLTGLAAVATPLITILLTDKWIETVPFLQISCLLYMPTVGMIPRHQALNGTGRSDVFMYEHIIARIASLIVLILTYRISIFAIVVGSIFSTAILCIIVAYTSKRFNGYKYKDQINDIKPTIIGCIVMGIPVYCLQFLGLSDILTLVLQIVAGTLIYVAYSAIFRLNEYNYCKQLLLAVKNKLQRK